jgi:hypothetical protein
MHAGELVTFQLYWSQMQGAYKGLMDVISSFTRAAGAASRVSPPNVRAQTDTHERKIACTDAHGRAHTHASTRARTNAGFLVDGLAS